MTFADYLEEWWIVAIRLVREIALAFFMSVGLVALGISLVSGWVARNCSEAYNRIHMVQPGTPQMFKFGQE